MKNLFYTLCLILTIPFATFADCDGGELIVDVTAVKNGCNYIVTLDVYTDGTPGTIDDFNVFVFLGGASSSVDLECDFPFRKVWCDHGSDVLNLWAPNGGGATSEFIGHSVFEVETENGCLTFIDFLEFEDCVRLGSVSGFCTDSPEPTGVACMNFVMNDDPPCEASSFTHIIGASGCSEQEAFVPPGEGICFDTFDDECVEITLDPGDCGCQEENPISDGDIDAIIEHILGKKPMNAAAVPFADVNCDGIITAVDLITIRRAQLGIPRFTNIPEGCPNVGDCVMIDENGEVVTEICPFVTNVTMGVWGDIDGSCDPCGNGEYELKGDGDITSDFDIGQNQGSVYVSFSENSSINAFTLDLSVGNDFSMDHVVFSEELSSHLIDQQLIEGNLHLMFFSESPITVNKGDVFLELNTSEFQLSGDFDFESNVYFADTQDSKLLGVETNGDLRYEKDFSITSISDSGQLLIEHNFEGETILLRVLNTAGQILYEMNHTNEADLINVQLPQNEKLFFVSMISETEMVTKSVFH